MSRCVVTAVIVASCVNAGAAVAEEHEEHQRSKPSVQSSEHATHQGHSKAADQPTQSELEHVPPEPPQHPMPDVSKERAIELMRMEDDASFSMVRVDELEWRDAQNADVVALKGQAWHGTDYNKLWFKVEGERAAGEQQARTELLWDRIFSRWWSVQAGVRHDFNEGPSRTWAALGVQGIAPYWFEIEAAAYVGEQGRTAARFSADYELLLTQRLVLRPEIEFNLYGKEDRENGIGSGLSDTQIGLRLRYEFRREFAPYVGIVWTRAFGNTADIAHAVGRDTDDLQFVAGLRIWY